MTIKCKDAHQTTIETLTLEALFQFIFFSLRDHLTDFVCQNLAKNVQIHGEQNQKLVC
jgi:hypothetical protein